MPRLTHRENCRLMLSIQSRYFLNKRPILSRCRNSDHNEYWALALIAASDTSMPCFEYEWTTEDSKATLELEWVDASESNIKGAQIKGGKGDQTTELVHIFIDGMLKLWVGEERRRWANWLLSSSVDLDECLHEQNMKLRGTDLLIVYEADRLIRTKMRVLGGVQLRQVIAFLILQRSLCLLLPFLHHHNQLSTHALRNMAWDITYIHNDCL